MERLSICRTLFRLPLISALLLSPLLPRAVSGDEDALEPPWGTLHGDLAGTAASTRLSYGLGEGPMEEKWRIDIVGQGHDRPNSRSSIVFDAEGNLYWITGAAGGTAGQVRLVSASPAGEIRWAGNDGSGNIHVIGSVSSGASPVVGAARVYATGDQLGILAVAAYDKATGENLWTADLGPSTISGLTLTPALYKGKLYVLGVREGKIRDVHRVDAESGNVDWSSIVEEVGISAVGQMTFLPEVFGAGLHGLYFNGDSNNGADGVSEAYGIRVSEEGAEVAWQNEAGKAARSHTIYSEITGLLYAFTWTDYGAEAYVFEPTSGLLAAYNNTLNTGHGFYDVGCLDFDGTTLIAGGFDGNILRYTDTGGGVLSDSLVYKGGTSFPVPYWGETRVLAQLLQAPGGNSVLLSATNSFQCCASHLFALDVTEGKLLWEYDTGSRNDHQFLYAGGPLMGPDGKIYYFERPAGGTTALVAVGLADEEPAPTAGFIVVEKSGRPVATAAGQGDPCVLGGESARFDASCSTGRDLVYRWSVEPPDGAVVLQTAPEDSSAEIRFKQTGDFQVTLEVENAGDTAECQRTLCVQIVQPVCELAVTDQAGAPIDNADDEDDVPCLPPGGVAVASADASTGGDLEFSFRVTPSAGTSIDQGGDPRNPEALITITDAGVYRIGVLASNGAGESQCVERTICVEAAVEARRFMRGDCNAGGFIDISDAVFHLGVLFLGVAAPSCMEACNSNGDGLSDVSDPVYLLNSLFLGGTAPPEPYPACGSPAGPLRLTCERSTC